MGKSEEIGINGLPGLLLEVEAAKKGWHNRYPGGEDEPRNPIHFLIQAV